MKNKSMKYIALAAASVMALSALPADISAKAVKSDFNRSAYCIIDGTYENGKAVISWDKFDGADQYLIYRSTDGGKYKLIAKTKKLSVTDKNCQKGHNYSYNVYALKGNTKSAVSEYVYVGVDKDGEADVYIYDVPTDYEPYKPKNDDIMIEDEICYDEAVDDVYYEEMADAALEVPAYEGIEGGGDVLEEADDTAEAKKPNYYFSGQQGEIKAGTLTAGKLDDNASYASFLRTMGSNDYSSLMQKWMLDTNGRYTVKVTDGKKPVENAKVKLMSDKNKVICTFVTNNKGIAYVYPSLLPDYTAESLKILSPDGTQTETKKLSEIKGSSLNITFKEIKPAEKTLDLMFLVDTTGSMWDELEYLEKEMEDVINRVSKDNGNIKIRVSVDFYRDTGDLYKVRSFPFRERISTVQKSLADQNASGGGDYPEAVHTALNVAVNKTDWAEDSTKIMFMVLDAPAHDSEDVIKDYRKRVMQAASKGIRIVPVVSSGTDTETEYLMRSAAVITGGKYLYLTDHSGIGYDHKKPDAAAAEVYKLNDLMVSIIDGYLK